MRHPKSLCDERVPSHDYLSAFLVSISSVAFWLCYLTSIFCSVFVNSMISKLLLNAYLTSLFFSFFFFFAASIANPYAGFRLFRNPKFKNAGKYLTLSEFLALSKNASSLTGVLISIEVSICYACIFLDA